MACPAALLVRQELLVSVDQTGLGACPVQFLGQASPGGVSGFSGSSNPQKHSLRVLAVSRGREAGSVDCEIVAFYCCSPCLSDWKGRGPWAPGSEKKAGVSSQGEAQ